MWQHIKDHEGEWVGGTLRDYGDSMDRAIMGGAPMETTITGIELDDHWFGVKGKDFSCGGARSVLGIGAPSFPMDDNSLCMIGYGGHEWHIAKP